MKVYKLSFHERGFETGITSGLLPWISEIEGRENLFFQFGEMDFMTVIEENNFSNMVTYQGFVEYQSELNPKIRDYLRETIFLIDETDCDDMLLFNKELRSNHLYLICKLKLKHIIIEKGNYRKLILELRTIFNKRLEFITKKTTDNASPTELFQCFGSTGAFDIILLCASPSINQLLLIQEILSDIKILIHNTDINMAEEQPLFSLAHTYLVASDELNPESLHNDICSADIQICANQELDVSLIKNKIVTQCNAIELSENTKILRNSQNDSITLRISNASIINILKAFPLWIHNTIKENDGNIQDDSYNKWYIPNHPCTNTVFFINTTISETNTLVIKNVFYSQLPVQALWKIIINQGLELTNNKLIPEVSIHAFNLLIDTCCYLLLNSRQHHVGIRFACIVYYAFKTILDRHDYLEPMAVSRCLYDLCISVNMSIQSDSFQLDELDKNSINPSNSVSKFLYSFEHILQLANSKLTENDSPNAAFLFLSIGLSELVESTFYFRSEPGDLKKFVSINLPNTSFFSSHFSNPCIYHELGHYVGIEKDDQPLRNISYYEIIKRYCTIYIYDTLYRSNEHFDVGYAKDFVDLLFSLIDKPDMNVCSFDAFVASVRKHITICYDYIYSLYYSQNEQIIDKFINAVRSLVDETDYFHFFYHVYKETHADIIMIKLGKLDIIEYLNMQYNAMEQKKLVLSPENRYRRNRVWPANDRCFQLRISTVISILAPEQTLEHFKEKLDQYTYTFFRETFQTYNKTKRLLKPLVNYLNEKIYSKNNLCSFNNLLPPKQSNLSDSSSFGKTIESLMELWYKNIEFWHKQAEEIISSNSLERE